MGGTPSPNPPEPPREGGPEATPPAKSFKSQTISFRLTASQVDMLKRMDPAIGDSIHERARFLLIQGLLEWNRQHSR